MLIVRRLEIPAQHRFHAQCTEIIRAHLLALKPLRLSLSNQGRLPRLHGGESIKRPSARLDSVKRAEAVELT